MQEIMTRLKLTVNDRKTHVCRVPEEHFDFLGYTFGRFYSTQTGRAYLGTRPSKKSVRRMLEKVHVRTAHSQCLLDADEVVSRINRMLRGWANYFQLGPVTKAYRTIDRYTTRRLRRWLRHKHKLQGGCCERFPDEYLYGELGLVRLSHLTRDLPWANA